MRWKNGRVLRKRKACAKDGGCDDRDGVPAARRRRMERMMHLKQGTQGEVKPRGKGGGRARGAWVCVGVALTIIMMAGSTGRVVTGQPNKEIINSGRFMVGNNAIIVQEGADKSIIRLPDNATIYYAVVLKVPYSLEIEQNLKSFGARIIKPNPYYGYYVISSAESAKKIANITYVRWVGQISFEQKFEEDLLQKATDNPNSVYLVDIVVLEKPSTSEEALIKQKGKVVEYAEVPKFYRMQVEGKNLLDIAKLGVVENIELVRETITTDEQSSSNRITQNQSQKTIGEAQKTVEELTDQNKTSSKSSKTDTFLLFAFSGIVALSVSLLILLKLIRRKNK